MIILLSGPSHTGKTLLAQRLLEHCHYPYLSLDHLKMGMIRSKTTDITVFDDKKMTAFLWPIVREMIKTAIENHQNLVVEGCYIPFTWRNDFSEEYLCHIHCRFLIFSPQYIQNHFEDIRNNANAIEARLDDSSLNSAGLIADNQYYLAQCQTHNCEYILIHDNYRIDLSQILP